MSMYVVVLTDVKGLHRAYFLKQPIRTLKSRAIYVQKRERDQLRVCV